MKSWIAAAVLAVATLAIAAPVAVAHERHGQSHHHDDDDDDDDRYYRSYNYNGGYGYRDDRRGYDHRRRYDAYGSSAAIIIRGRGGELVIRANEGGWGQLLGAPYNWRPNYIYHYTDYCDRRGCRVSVHDRFRGHHVGYVFAPPPPRDCYRGRDHYYRW